MLRQEFGGRLLFLLFAIQHLIKGLGATIGGRANPYLCKEYHVSAQDMQILKTLIFSPYILKPMLGLTSDLFPIKGYNKAPYLLLATGAGVAAAFVVGLAEMPLRMFVLCLFLVELMICTDDLLTEAIYSRQMQDKPMHGQDLLTFVFAGMSFWSLLASLASGFLLTFLGARAVYLLVAACALPALVAAFTMQEPRKSASAVRAARAKIWRQKELFILALVMFGASVSLSSVAALTTRPVVNASVALLAALVVLAAFLLLLSPVIAKFAAFTLIQTSLHLSVSAPAFYFLTDTSEQYPKGPHFSKVFYNTCLGSVGSLATLLGLYSYNRLSAYFSYRTLLLVSNITFSVLHLADSLLFSRLNLALGIPDMAFAFGNQSLGPVVYQWLWMPQVGLFSQLCPKGIEATMFALIVACHNLGVAVANSCGALLLERLGCNPRGQLAESAEFDSLWLASAIASLLPLISVVALVALIPDVKPGERVSNIDEGDGTAGSLWKQWMGSEHTMLVQSDSS